MSQLPDGVLLVTFDVASLYSNIQHKGAIQACSDFLDQQLNQTVKTTRIYDLSHDSHK